MATCARCGRPASVMLDYRNAREDLCDQCLDAVVDIPFFSEFREALLRRPHQTGACPHCGTTRDQVTDTGLAGCPLCYVSLGDVWENLGITHLDQSID